MVAAMQPAPSDPSLALNATTVLLAMMASGDDGLECVLAADALPAALDALRAAPEPAYAEVLLDVVCRVGSSPHRGKLLEGGAVPVLLDCLQPTPSDRVVRALLALGMVVNGTGVLTTIAAHTYV